MMNQLAKALLCMSVSSLATSAAFAQEVATEEAPADEGIVVTGTRGSINASRDAERSADGIKNVITADDAGQFADQNVAESLQRLPGVSIERSEGEGRFVSVRGLDPAFNNVTLNGVKLGSTEKGNGSVALDILPADLLDQVEVSKTPTPDQDGDAIGGTIEIKTLSAFDRKNQIQARVEGSYNQIADKISPKVSGSITRLFANDTIGVAIAGSYFGRKVQSDQLRNDEGLRCVRVGAATNALAVVNPTDTGCDEAAGYFMRPQELDVRIKSGERERIGGTINLEYKPTDDDLFFIRATHTRITDDDTRFQEETEFRRVTDRRDIRAVGPRSGTMDGIRYETQIFQQEIADRVWSASFGGEKKLGDLKVDFQQDWSRTTRKSPGIRARFQGRNGLSQYTLDENSIDITSGPGVRRTTGTIATVGTDPRVPANMLYEQLFIDAETGEDEIYTTKLDFTYTPEAAAVPTSIKAGLKYRERQKQADVDEFDFAARSAPLNRTESLANFTQFVPRNTRLPLYGQFPVLSELNTILEPQRALIASLPSVLVNSSREDFKSEEKVLAGYVMGSIEPFDGFKLISGIRVERTRFNSQGQFVFDSDGSVLVDATIPNPRASKTFTEVLPSVIVRYDASPTLLFRGAWTFAIQRPNFDDTRNVHSALDDGTQRSLELQNPLLDPAKAMQFDASASWYPDRNTGITVGFFYKRIRDFIVDTNLINVADIRTIAGGSIPLPAAIPGGFAFTSVEVPLNGNVGKIYGIEAAYSQSFTFLPQPFNGLFISASGTWAKSTADIDVRAGSFAFPGQPKWVANGSIGYEDKLISLRGSVTYKDKTVESIASVAPLDEVRASYLSYDVNFRFNVTKDIQLYADAINLSNERDEIGYRGDRNGGYFAEIERFGRTFQVGIRATF
jgi:iron complex outermembrane recepter protein